MTPPRLTTRGRTFLALGVVVVGAAALLGFPDVTRIGVLLALLPVLAAASIWRRAPRLELRRTVVPAQVQRGDSGHVELVLHNVGRHATLPHLAEERLDPRLGAPARFVLPRMAPGERRTVSYGVEGRVRGTYRPGPLTLTLTDPFGLACSRTELPGSGEVVVLPRIVALDGAGVRRQGGAGEWPVPHMVATQGEDDVSTRNYQLGDDLRRIHWPATAHRAELMVRQEEQPARRRAVLVLDSRRLGHRGQGDASSFEWAVSALASAAVHLAGRGYGLHLVSTETVREGRAATVLSLGSVLRYLALALPEAADLEPVLRTARPLTAGVVVAVMSDGDPAALQPFVRARPGGTVGVMLVLDAPGFAGAPADGGAERAAAVARAAGWRTHVVTAGTDVASAWRRVTASRQVVR
ncbi:uncharacterized protein (DUF58 family) [Georgenia soli]|uniref:Uncharacterized protein (DUF58 family) n=1 Tax=Georgenia soli TaxID=638953 RepID=A0A2A9EIK0_9MICO|nr:DUF58 domain-containing protein [Georgenia soli]PFG38085.1 uncharacterized protein (DUF58 family) [Georgenia soli]